MGIRDSVTAVTTRRFVEEAQRTIVGSALGKKPARKEPVERQKRSHRLDKIDFAAFAVAGGLMWACKGPLAPSSGADSFVQWPEAEQRIQTWLRQHPECPNSYVMPSVSLVNEKPTLKGAACEYSPSERLIRAPEPYFSEVRFGMGCVAHELGHAALHQAGNPCGRRYEH